MKTIAFLDAGTLRPTIVSNRLNLPGPSERFDWRLFVKWLGTLSGNLFDIHYYDALPDLPTNGLGHFHTFLQQELKIQLHLTNLRTKRKNCPHCNNVITEDVQKSVDVSLAIDMFRLAPHYDQALLVSGDGDFSEVVKIIRGEFGRRVITIGWKTAIAPQLRINANEILCLEDHAREFIGRTDEVNA
jgi:uncharacterized LabA/DUF88 family protein